MMMRKKSLGVLAIGLGGLALAQGAHATVYGWSFTPGEPQPVGGGYEISNAAGTFHSVFATYDDVSQVLTFDLNFSDRVTQGFWMAMNDGPMPRERPGQLGLLYFDADDVFDGDAGEIVRLTAYGYNGVNNGSTYFDGDGATDGNQAPDLIHGINDTSWINSASAADVVLPGGINGRRLSFSIDASTINSHVPLYPDTGVGAEPWFGIGFADLVGIWLHPVGEFGGAYNAEGGVAAAVLNPQGWLDGNGFTSFIIPSPGAGATGLLALGVLAGRRRRR